MNVFAMICELNPLHNGHLRVLERMRADDPDAAILLVMSGNFTQRAGAAMFDKYERARAAIESGADLVLELPFPFSSAGAEDFSRAGVEIAEALGADALYFGSECGDIDRLRCVAATVDSDEYRALSAAISESDPTLGAAAIRERALRRLLPDVPGGRAEAPNDTLAVEYIRRAHIPCVAVRRTDTASASEIRRMTVGQADSFIPAATKRMMTEAKRSDDAVFRRLLWENLRLRAPEDRRGNIAGANLRRDISAFAECAGGLGDRLVRLAGRAKNADEFFAAVATKRYTNARILRAALYAVCGVTPEDVAASVRFTVLLGASENGRRVLAARRKDSPIAVVTKPADMLAHNGDDRDFVRAAELAGFADSLYTLTFMPPLDAGDFRKRTPYVG